MEVLSSICKSDLVIGMRNLCLIYQDYSNAKSISQEYTHVEGLEYLQDRLGIKCESQEDIGPWRC